MNRNRPQSGFTLIEALIAFVVLTVGILGALLFQSELVRESGDSKARAEAIRIAEAKVELLRAAATSSAFASIIGTGPQVASVPDGSNNVYTVTYASQAVSSAEFNADLTRVNVTVSWSDGAESLSLSSIVNWLDPALALQLDEAGTAEDDGSGSTALVPNPGGLATALERVSVGVGSVSSGHVQREQAVIDGKEVSRSSVLVDDKYYISLISTPSPSDAVMSIEGTILDNPSANTDIAWDYIGEAGGISESFLDVQSSTGANCIIYEIVNKDPSQGPRFARYKCLFSVGWTGNIGLIKNEADSNKIFEDGNDTVCSRNPVGYKYLIASFDVPSSALPSEVSPGQVSGALFSQTVSGSVISTNLQFDYSFINGASSANAAVVGQSGLVPFNTAVYDSDNYFFKNPNLDISSDAASSTSGSVFQQNFFVTKKLTGGATPCDIDYVNAVSVAAAAANLNGGMSASFPTEGAGTDVIFGINATEDDIHEKSGEVILGYTLFEDTVSPAMPSPQEIVYADNKNAGEDVGPVQASDNVAVSNFTFVDSLSDTASGSVISPVNGYFTISQSGMITITTSGASSAANDYSLSPNSHVYYVKATDAAGNYTTAKVTLVEEPAASATCSLSIDSTSVNRTLKGASFVWDYSSANAGSVTVTVTGATLALEPNGTTFTITNPNGKNQDVTIQLNGSATGCPTDVVTTYKTS